MNAWAITKDHIAVPGAKPGTNHNAAGMTGPRNNTRTAGQIASHPAAKPFRMFGDDGDLYYEGFLVGDEFGPLDDFGEPNAGCTRIHIKENGLWSEV